MYICNGHVPKCNCSFSERGDLAIMHVESKRK